MTSPTCTSCRCQLGDVVGLGSPNRNTFRSSAIDSAASTRSVVVAPHEEVKQRRLRWARHDLEPVDCGKLLRNRARVPEVHSHARETLVEPPLGGDDERMHRDEVAAVAPLPDPRLRDGARVRRQRSAGQSAQTLVEGDIDAVEQIGDRRVGAPVERLRLPQPCAVEVQGNAPLARPGGLRDELSPGGEATAELPLWKLEQKHSHGLVDRLEVGE